MRLCILLAAAAATLPAQQSIEGEVVDALTGAAVAGVRVGRFGEGVSLTDAAGHFRVSAAPEQTYLSLNQPGYLPAAFGLTLGKSDRQVLVQLTPQAVIAGRIVDEDGIAMEGAMVAAYQYRYLFGRRQLYKCRPAVLTGETGEYRIFNLPAGRYYIRVVPSYREMEWDGRYGPQFFPDSVDAAHADLVEVSAGQERHDVNMRLSKKEGVTVSGRYTIPKGAAPPRITLRSMDYPLYQEDFQREVRGASAGAQFVFTHVPPGRYVLGVPHQGVRGPIAGELSASQQIEVGATDVHDLVIDVRPLEPVELTGKVVFQGTATPRPVTVEITGGPAERLNATSQADSSFVIKGVLPGTHSIWVREGTANSIRLGGREVMQSGFELGAGVPGTVEITVGDGGRAKFSAKVVDGSGRGIAGVLVFLWPLSGDRIVRVTTDTDGVATVPLAPVGDYHIYLPAAEWMNASFDDSEYREAHAGDFPGVHLSPGSTTALTLPLK